MPLTLREAIARFGADAKAKLSNPAAIGEPEDQLRAPLEQLLGDLAELVDLPRSAVVAVGESSLSQLKTRPDYAITVRNALVGFLEVKAPGKGADPRRYRDRHDKEQWEKLQSLPNLVYTDGNAFSLWRSGELEGSVVRLMFQLPGKLGSYRLRLDAHVDRLPAIKENLGSRSTRTADLLNVCHMKRVHPERNRAPSGLRKLKQHSASSGGVGSA